MYSLTTYGREVGEGTRDGGQISFWNKHTTFIKLYSIQTFKMTLQILKIKQYTVGRAQHRVRQPGFYSQFGHWLCHLPLLHEAGNTWLSEKSEVSAWWWEPGWCCRQRSHLSLWHSGRGPYNTLIPFGSTKVVNENSSFKMWHVPRELSEGKFT